MKKTTWFPRLVPPIRPGLYEVVGDSFGRSWSWFDGVGFNGCWSKASNAVLHRNFHAEEGFRGTPVVKWRGLASKDGK